MKLNWSHLAAILLIVAAVPASFRALNVETDNSIERWLDRESEDSARHDHFKELFGNDEFILIAVGSENLFSRDTLDLLVLLQERLEREDSVARVWGIQSVYENPLIGKSPELLRKEIQSSPLYNRFLISDDLKTSGTFAFINPSQSPSARRILMRSVRNAIVPLEKAGLRVAVAGPTALNVALDEMSEREATRSLGFALAATLIILVIAFRSVHATIAVGIASGMSTVLTLGLMEWAGGSFNMVTSALPAIVWVVSIAHGIHTVFAFRRAQIAEEKEDPFAEVRFPCSLSALTTAVGFLSLTLSNMAPVRELGFYAAAGMVMALAVNLTVLPVILNFQSKPRQPKESTSSARLAGILMRFILKKRRTILYLSILGGTLGIVCAFQMQPESNPLKFLPETHPVAQDSQFVKENLTGLYSLEIVVQNVESWLDSDNLSSLERLSTELASHPAVAKVLSPIDVLKKLNQLRSGYAPGSFRLPDSAPEATRLASSAQGIGKELLDGFVARDGRVIRVSALVNTTDSKSFYNLVRNVDNLISDLPESMAGFITGTVLRLNEAQKGLVRGQLRSFCFAFACIFLMLLIGFRSFRLMGVAIPPNLFPILLIPVLMTLFAIHLDPATVTVAGISMGIAVDDTVHLLSAWRRIKKSGKSETEAVAVAIQSVAPPVIVTTLALCAGFFTLCFSGFLPVRYFGLLSGAVLIFALLADLLLLPAILLSVSNSSGRCQKS